jgi:hypothetical protein
VKSARTWIYPVIVLAAAAVIYFLMNKPANHSALMLDSFEGPLNAKTVDFGSDDTSSLAVTAATDQKMCGAQALKMTYTLEPGGYMWCARGYGLDVLGATWEAPPPQNIDWAKYNAVSFMLYGDGKGASLAFDVKDAGGELHRFMVTDNTPGWREVLIPFSAFKPRADWQPSTADGNHKLDLPIRSFQWEPKTPGSGTFYFDCVKLVHVSPGNGQK